MSQLRGVACVRGDIVCLPDGASGVGGDLNCQNGVDRNSKKVTEGKQMIYRWKIFPLLPAVDSLRRIKTEKMLQVTYCIPMGFAQGEDVLPSGDHVNHR